MKRPRFELASRWRETEIKKSRFSEEQIIAVPKMHQAGIAVADIHGFARRQPRLSLFPMCCGAELTSMAILKLCRQTGVAWHDIAPGILCADQF